MNQPLRLDSAILEAYDAWFGRAPRVPSVPPSKFMIESGEGHARLIIAARNTDNCTWRTTHGLNTSPSPQNPMDGGIPSAPPVDSKGYSMVDWIVA